MKLHIISASADGRIDGSIKDGLLSQLPGITPNLSDADAVIVPVSYLHDFRFNRNLLAVTKRVVLIDFTEYGWEAGTKPNILGRGALRNFGHLDSDEWGALDQWAAAANIVAHFKRELQRKDVSEVLLPVDYPCRLPIPPRQSKADFERRPLEVFSSWGLSNPARQVLHGEIFKEAHRCGLHVVDAWDQDQHFDGKTWDSKWPQDGRVWATIHTPHYNRKPMSEVMRWQHRAKLSVSLPGSGVKCFRSAEAPVGAVMALQHDAVTWSYDWVHGENCIRLTPGKEFGGLLAATERDDLYELYLAGQDTIAHYRPQTYVADYLLPAIAERVSGTPAKTKPEVKRARPKSRGEHVNQFVHRGDLGDIIACLPAIRAAGGGELLICPHRPHAPTMQGREDLRGARFNVIKPLIEIQPYIRAFRWVEEQPEDAIDFSTFRQNTVLGQSLSQHQARHIGVTISEEPWLTVPSPNDELRDRILVARTARYQNWQFPWRQIADENRDRLLFVGLPGEHKEFCKLVGPIEYLPTRDFLELAQAIAGSQLLIANQTAAGWIAHGLGHPLIQEQWEVSRDSVIPRENAQYCLYTNMPRIPAIPGKPIAKDMQQAKPSTTVTICFPFHNGDRQQALALAEQIRDLGAGADYQCLAIYPTGTNAEEILEVLRAGFASVEELNYAATLEGWPQGPNEMFAEAAMLIARDPRFHDFLWAEPDIVLATGKAFQTIENAYRTCGQPIMGVSVDTVAMDSKQIAGRHVVGVAVYPKNFAQICPLVRHLKAMSAEYRRGNSVPLAFDAYFGAYTVARNAETWLIQHFWRSEGFRDEGGAIVAGKTVSPGVENVVNPGAVLLHGCKDGSLMEIMRRRQGLEASDGGAEIPSPVSFHPVRTEAEPFPPSLGDTTSGTPGVPAPWSILPPTPKTGHVLKGASIPGSAAVHQTLEEALAASKKQQPVPPEQWILGEDGRPVPPFMFGQPEFERARALFIARYETKGFAKLRKYAGALKINTFGMGADQIIEQVVLAERKKGNEEWTKGLQPVVIAKPEPPAPAPEPVNPAGWSQDKPAGDGNQISEAMRQKMIAMRKERGMPVTV